MINGYVTYDELKIITGFDSTTLDRILRDGLTCHEFEFETLDRRAKYHINKKLYNLNEVLDWICIHVY